MNRKQNHLVCRIAYGSQHAPHTSVILQNVDFFEKICIVYV